MKDVNKWGIAHGKWDCLFHKLIKKIKFGLDYNKREVIKPIESSITCLYE